jgi:hypothetical protein
VLIQLLLTIVLYRIEQLIGVQDEDSCGKSVLGETPQERSDEEAHQPPAESEVLHGNQMRC